jgi:hypothetical protein
VLIGVNEMGLEFIVGHPSLVFEGDVGLEVLAAIESQFGPLQVNCEPRTIYRSEEIAWGGWSALQHQAATILGVERVPHLLAVEAWRGVYLPIRATPATITLPTGHALECASLINLLEELQLVAEQSHVTVTPDALHLLWEKAINDQVTETLCQALLSAMEASQRRQLLWIIK